MNTKQHFMYPVGVSDFRQLLTEDYVYVDKTPTIQSVVNDGGDVLVCTRPRRFGKTLFMSILMEFKASRKKYVGWVSAAGT